VKSQISVDMETFWQKLQNVAASILPVFPQGSGLLFGFAFLLAVLVGVVIYIVTRPTPDAKRNTQLAIYRPTYQALAQRRKGIDEYLNVKAVKESQNNWVLLNFAPLTMYNAGYLGPNLEGMYDPQSISFALGMGFRCFVFHIDYYTGTQKDPKYFVPPGDPCLLHRDNQGIIRSKNSGKLDEMVKVLRDEAFSINNPCGRDPLLVILDFKNTPDRIQDPEGYKRFLMKVAEQLQPLRNSFLARLGETRFSNLENQNLLFTQGIQSLRGKTIILTNANTDIFNTGTTPINNNLRSLINAQIFITSGSSLATDMVTQIAPKGIQMAAARENTDYFLLTPPDRLQDAQAATNNVYTLVNVPDTRVNLDDDQRTKLLNTYGVQMIPYNLFLDPAQTEAFLNGWGPYSWAIKPKLLQYVVVRQLPPRPLNPSLNANQGNVRPPALKL
jgi:hypothetical protein